jgi:hypothetical protein
MLMHLLDIVVLMNQSILEEALRRGGHRKSGHMNDFHDSRVNLMGSYLFLQRAV